MITRRSLSAAAAFVSLAAVASAQDLPVRLSFRAVVGNEPFACGRQYPGVGVAGSTIEATEFKYFVSDVQLLRADGSAVPVQLTQDGLWQNGNVALLDHENGTGGCRNGNAELRDVVEGTAPAGTYQGVRFTMGVPFERNHADLTAAPSPLSLTRMFWAWNSGYKFLRIDLKTGDAQNWMVHLGSTECTPTGSATTVPTSCKFGNRVTVSLADFDPSRDALVFDVAELLRASDVSKNQPKTASGCMSGATDGDCTGLFASLGLAHGTSPAGTQRVFRVGRNAVSAPNGGTMR